MTKQITLTEGVEVPFDFDKYFVIYKYYFMCKGIITSLLMKADIKVKIMSFIIYMFHLLIYWKKGK